MSAGLASKRFAQWVMGRRRDRGGRARALGNVGPPYKTVRILLCLSGLYMVFWAPRYLPAYSRSIPRSSSGTLKLMAWPLKGVAMRYA